MIIRPAAGGWHLITQPDHAALARQMMERWRALGRARRRASILLAIGEHDNGWREADATPLRDPATGAVLDFVTAPARVRQGVWPRGVARLAATDGWAAALVAQHALTVYDRYRGDPAWTAFFDEMRATRDRLAAEDGDGLDALLEAYAFVRIGDLLSLIFCNAWDEAHTYDGKRMWLEGDVVRVTPDPFGGDEVPFTVDARALAQAHYPSEAALSRAWAAAPAVVLSGRVVGQ